MNRRYQHLAAVERALFQQHSTTQILYISEKEKKKFLTTYATPPERFHKLPPGVERADFDCSDLNAVRVAKRQEFGLDEEQKLILFVGSGFKIKGLDRALTAMASLPDEVGAAATLLVVGQDNPRPYRALLRRLGLSTRVQFLQGRDDVPLLLQAADCLLHPARNETGGTVLLEAAIHGVPVLTTDACGYASYIRQANMGIVLPLPFAQAQLNQALLQLLGATTERVVWLRRGKILANTADIFSMPEKCADFLENLLASS